jgi:hypothetical protein
MKIKSSELIDLALDWAVAKCKGREPTLDMESHGRTWRGWWLSKGGEYERMPSYSTDGSQGVPILERELHKLFRNVGGTFTAQIKRRVPYYSPTYDADIGIDETISRSGPTMLIAAMRCYVASKLGEEVEVPDELIEASMPHQMTRERQRS